MAKNTKVLIYNNRILQRALNKLLASESYVKVGILSKPDNGDVRATDKKAEVLSDGIIVQSDATVAEIGYYHEFGKGNLPQRSFLRSTWDTEKKKIEKVYMAGLKRMLKKGADPDKQIETVMKFTGAWFVGRVRRKFTNNDWPRLEDPSRGGRNFEYSSGFIGPPRKSMPLIDTGQLRASIAYQIIDMKKEGMDIFDGFGGINDA